MVEGSGERGGKCPERQHLHCGQRRQAHRREGGGAGSRNQCLSGSRSPPCPFSPSFLPSFPSGQRYSNRILEGLQLIICHQPGFLRDTEKPPIPAHPLAQQTLQQDKGQKPALHHLTPLTPFSNGAHPAPRPPQLTGVGACTGFAPSHPVSSPRVLSAGHSGEKEMGRDVTACHSLPPEHSGTLNHIHISAVLPGALLKLC